MKVLFIDSVHPYLWNALSENGYLCIDGTALAQDQLFAILPDFHGVVIRSKFTIDKSFLDKAISLRFVARSGSGLENIDVEAAAQKNVQVFNSPEGNRDAVGEHAIGMLLALLNNIVTGNREVKSGTWQREGNRGEELGYKTVGIIGYGNTGSAFAKKLGGFGCRILAYDKYKKGFGNEHVKEADLEELFAEADIVSLHIPYKEETHCLVNVRFLSQFQKPVVLINTSRGKIVETAALVEALQQGTVKGACLDVLEYEQSSFEQLTGSSGGHFQYLRSADNVILTPHVAGWTVESHENLSKYLADKILAHFGAIEKAP